MSIKSKFLFVAMLAILVVAGGAFVGVKSAAAADCSLGTATLRVGSTGAEVMCLQTIVGATSDGHFGPMTKAAVMAWQSAHSLVADGVVGPLTRAAMGTAPVAGTFPAGCTSTAGYSTTTGLPCNTASNLPAGCTSTTGYSPTTGVKCDSTSGSGTLVGGAGSVDTYALTSNITNEKVGEGQSDVQVLGLEITPSDSSDLSVSAMKLVFTPGTATAKFIKYATDVSIWSGSTLLARVPAENFTSANDYTQTISFSKPAIIKAGVKGTLYVAVSGATTIDSTLQGETWTLDVASVRWSDAQGALFAEDPGTNPRTMTFDTATVGTNTSAQISEGDTSVDTSHVVQISDTSTTTDVSLLSFKIKVLGTSPVYLDSLPITLTGSTNIDDIISGGLNLAMDGNNIGSADLSTDALNAGALSADYGATHTTAGYRFSKLATVLQPGTHTFLVTADINSKNDIGAQGETIQGTFGQTEITYAYFDLSLGSDGNGNAIDTGDITGGETADAIAFYSKGISVVLVGNPTATVVPGDATVPTVDHGTYAMTFDVTAFGSDVYVDHSAPAVEAAGSNSESSLTQNGAAGGSFAATMTSPSGATDGTNGYKVSESTTQRFTITMNLATAADGFYGFSLNDLRYALTDVDATTSYTFGLDSFKTPQIYLNTN